jgi:hypothetical protein
MVFVVSAAIAVAIVLKAGIRKRDLLSVSP